MMHGVSLRCTTTFKNAHGTVFRKLLYPWHPWFGAQVAVPAFGYKNHIGIDRVHGLIRTWRATDAARHDGAQLPKSDR